MLEPADSAGPVCECDRQLWAIVVAATPVEVLRYVDELLVFDADLSADTAVGEVFAQPNSTEASAHWRLPSRSTAPPTSISRSTSPTRSVTCSASTGPR